MHLCYVDDSGDPSRGKLLTALLIRDTDWADVLDAWLTGREELHRLFGVHKRRELHANKLFKGRGQFCESPEQESAFSSRARAKAARIALGYLSEGSPFDWSPSARQNGHHMSCMRASSRGWRIGRRFTTHG